MNQEPSPASVPISDGAESGSNVGLPTVSEREYVQWGAFNPETRGYAFTTEDRAAAERMMRGVAKRNPHAVLIRQPMRSRCETWWGEVEVVPWHTPCEWIAQADENDQQIGESWCMAHKHAEGTPVPPEHVRGHGVTPPVNDGPRR